MNEPRNLSSALRALREKATRGPFSTEDCPGGDTMLVSKDGDLVCHMGRPEDVALFIATHNAFPVLLAALELAEAVETPLKGLGLDEAIVAAGMRLAFADLRFAETLTEGPNSPDYIEEQEIRAAYFEAQDAFRAALKRRFR